MIDKILGEDNYEDLFYASMLSGLMTEKQAQDIISGIEKDAQPGGSWLSRGAKLIGSLGAGALELASGAIKAVPPATAWTAMLGASTGSLGALAYDAIKERVSREDPETKFNNDMEAMYNLRTKEKEDAKWMSKIVSMRDDLRRNYKKMSTEEYSRKYKALVDALNERAVA